MKKTCIKYSNLFFLFIFLIDERTERKILGEGGPSIYTCPPHVSSKNFAGNGNKKGHHSTNFTNKIRKRNLETNEKCQFVQ